MPFYRIYPLDELGRIRPPVDVDCADDHDAIVYAAGLQEQVRHGCEVWRQTSFVGRFHFQAETAG